MRNDAKRPPNTVEIVLKHHNDPEGKFQPKHKTCQDYPDPKTGVVQRGCGGSFVRYITHPRGKGIYFDAPGPIVVQQFPIRQDGAVIAWVSNENVHFVTCPHRQRASPQTSDFRTAAAGAVGE